MGMFSWFRKGEPYLPPSMAAVPRGLRVYAIGDVHGRFDLLQPMLRLIERDSELRGPAEIHVILLGDLIDRGPQSREVIDFFLNDAPDFAQFHFIMGNHEEMLLRLIHAPDELSLQHFLRFGGRETFESYGAPQGAIDASERYPLETLPSYVPEAHRAFLRAMHDGLQFGDYFFTHAGIRPGVPLEQQDRQDLRWIRGGFLDSQEDHGVIVVHGHTVREDVEVRRNRIGIDTGAYASGRLTGLGLEGAARWLIHANGPLAR